MSDPTRWSPVDERPDSATPVAQRPAAVGGTQAAGRHRGLRRRRPMVFVALDDGARMLRSDARTVLSGSLIILLPLLAVGGWAVFIGLDRLEAAGSILPTRFERAAFTGIEPRAYVLASVMTSVSAAILGLFGSTLLVGDRFGHDVTLRWALRRTLHLAPRMLAVWVLTHWWQVLLAMWTFSGDGATAGGRGFVALFTATFTTIVTLYAAPVIVAEGAGVRTAVQRSWRLARSRFGAALSFVISCAVLSVLLVLGLAVLPVLVLQFGVETPGLALAAQVLATIGALLAMIVTAIATAQLYLSVRLDAEALDIVIDAAEAFGSGRA